MPTVALDVSQINSIVEAVFGTMLASAPALCASAWRPEPGRVSASVTLSRSWHGYLRVECAPAAALELTRRLMPVEPTEIDDDVRDAMGEIANMIGGNFKAILPRGTELSVPEVRVDDTPPAGEGLEVAYWVGSEPLWVIVREHAVD